jgi:hypothetical protein
MSIKLKLHLPFALDPKKPRKQAQLNFKKKLSDAALEVPPAAN